MGHPEVCRACEKTREGWYKCEDCKKIICYKCLWGMQVNPREGDLKDKYNTITIFLCKDCYDYREEMGYSVPFPKYK